MSMSEAEKARILGISTEISPTVTESPAEYSASDLAELAALEAAEKGEVSEPLVTETTVQELSPQVIENGVQAEPQGDKSITPTPTVVAAVEEMPVAQLAPTVQVKEETFASEAERNILFAINAYVQEMAPRKPVKEADVLRHQVLLYRTLTQAINNQTQDFPSTFGKILAIFHEHNKGVFHETRVFRGYENLPLSKQDRDAFTRLINLLKIAADPKTRKVALKQVDLVRSLQFGLTEPGRNRVMAYFNQ